MFVLVGVGMGNHKLKSVTEPHGIFLTLFVSQLQVESHTRVVTCVVKLIVGTWLPTGLLWVNLERVPILIHARQSFKGERWMNFVHMHSQPIRQMQINLIEGNEGMCTLDSPCSWIVHLRHLLSKDSGADASYTCGYIANIPSVKEKRLYMGVGSHCI